MNIDLKPFIRRVRLARAWRGVAIGLVAGGLGALLAALGDDFNLWYANLGLLIGLILGGAVVGLLVGLSAPLSTATVARSMDRRAGMNDRLTSVVAEHTGAFATDLERDAGEKVSQVKPSDLYPFRWSRWHPAALFCAGVPIILFLVTSGHLLLTDAEKKERETLKSQAKAVERVRAPLLEPETVKQLSPEEKQLQRTMEALQKQLEHEKLTPEEAQAKAEKISQEAEQLMRQREQAADQNLDTAKQAMMRADQSQAQKIDPSLAKLSGDALQQRMDQLQEMAKTAPMAMANLQRQMDEIQKEMAKAGLTKSQRDALAKSLEAMQQQMQQLQLSQKVKDMLERLHNNPGYRKLQELMAKLAKEASGANPGKRPPLTKEQLAEMQRKLEELADRLKTDKDMEAYIKALEEALKNKKVGQCLNPGLSLHSIGAGLGGAYAATDDEAPNGTKLNMLDKEAAGKGKTHTVGITGDRREDAPEPSLYMEERGPSKLTGPSSIPLLKEVGASRRKAEEAIDKQQIPKDQQERVKRYFESLGGGK